MSFASAASRLSGLVKGAFTGIEVLKRGVSPRIVSAYVLGSKGRTLVSGPELEARLGLYSTWAYFSVKSAKGVQRRAGRERAEPSAGARHIGTRTGERRRHREAPPRQPAHLRAGRPAWTARAACRPGERAPKHVPRHREPRCVSGGRSDEQGSILLA